jgi:hypothetical protein
MKNKQNIRLQVLLAVTMKIIVSWDVMPCSLVDLYQCIGGISCHQAGSSRVLLNVCNGLPEYTVSHSRM